MVILFIRSLLCNCIYLMVMIFGIPLVRISQIIFPRRIAIRIKIFVISDILLYSLRIFCNLKYEIIGNIPNDYEYCIFASKHQSLIEICILDKVLQCPAFIAKNSLFKIPFFGRIMKYSGSFGVNRQEGITAIRKMKKEIEKSKNINNKLVIFPEGTRTMPGVNTKLLPGVFMFYKMGYKIVPVALNTGKFWSRNSFWRKPGTIIIKFLPTIEEKNLNQEDFMKRLQIDINDNSAQLL